MNWSQSLFQKFLSEFRIFLSVAFSVPKVFNICQSLTGSWTLLPEHRKLSLVQVNYQCCPRESNINNQRNKILKRVYYYSFVKSLYEQNFAFCWYFRRDKPRFRNKPIVTLLQWLPSGFRVKQASPYADVLCFFLFFWGFERKERTDGSTEISIAPMAISHFVVVSRFPLFCRFGEISKIFLWTPIPRNPFDLSVWLFDRLRGSIGATFWPWIIPNNVPKNIVLWLLWL